MIRNLLLFIIIATTLSCKVTFTQRIRTQAENSKIDLSKIQFYNSDKIILKRMLSNDEIKVASGKITIENGKYIEVIRIKKNTPGKCNITSNNQLQISFEDGANRSFLFQNDNTFSPRGIYELKPDNCKLVKKETLEFTTDKNSMLPIKSGEKMVNECTVTYDDKKYKVELNAMPYLKIKKAKFTRKRQVKRRTAKGVKVS